MWQGLQKPARSEAETKITCLGKEEVKRCSGTTTDTTVLVAPTVEPGQMEEELSLESPHNTRILLATQVPPPSRKSEHRQVKWHVANSKEWTKLDEDVDKSLEAISKGNAERKLHTMCSLIMNIGVEHFGVLCQNSLTS